MVMTATQKTKLCWNCEGSAPIEEENCPYCGVYLGPSSEEDQSDLLAPPYRIHDDQSYDEAPPSPYADDNYEESPPIQKPLEEPKNTDLKTAMVPLILLLAGSVFFLFSMVLFLFSDHGQFTLQWNGDYWYIYLLIATPTLLFGWKSLQHLEG